MEYFTDNLQIVRKKLLLSQNDMAEKMGISYRAYSSYERGERKPTYDFLQKLVEDLNVNLNFLIANQGEMFIQKQPAGLKDEIRQTVLEMLKNGELPK